MTAETRSFTKAQLIQMALFEHTRGQVAGIDSALRIMREAAAQLQSLDNTGIRTCILDICDIIETEFRNPLHATLSNLTPPPHRQHNDELRPELPPKVLT